MCGFDFDGRGAEDKRLTAEYVAKLAGACPAASDPSNSFPFSSCSSGENGL